MLTHLYFPSYAYILSDLIVLPSFLALCVYRVAITTVADPVYVAAKKMRDLHVNSAIIMAGNKLLGILT